MTSRRGAIPSDLGWLVDELDGILERLRTVEAPSGEALSSTVATLQGLVSDIQAQLETWTSTRYTNAQIVSLIGTPPGTVNVANGALYNAPSYNTNLGGVPGARRALWVHENGLFGWASSSRERKTDIAPAGIDADAVLAIEPKVFRYVDAVRRHAELPEDQREGLEPRLEVGLIAEDLHDAGLGHFVVYDRAGGVEGIDYPMLVVALLAVDRQQQQQLDDLEHRLAALEAGR